MLSTNSTTDVSSPNATNKTGMNYAYVSNNANTSNDEDEDDHINENSHGYNSKTLKNENSNENMAPSTNEMEHSVKEITTLSKLNVYDTSKKARIPSWTDRILFRVRHQKPLTPISLDNDSSVDHHQKPSVNQYTNMNSIRIPLKPIIVEKYTSCENMHWSDHKPVIGSFRIDNNWFSDDTISNKKVVHRKTNKNACIIQ